MPVLMGLFLIKVVGLFYLLLLAYIWRTSGMQVYCAIVCERHVRNGRDIAGIAFRDIA
jgi:hypothetical protein